MEIGTAARLTRGERALPVDAALAGLLPAGGLQRGHVVGCGGPAAMSLALAVAREAVAAGAWLAAVGLPALGVEAAHVLGLPLARLVLVDATGGPAVWAERVAAAADGFELVLTQPPPGAERAARQVRHRLVARGAVLLAVDPVTPRVACDVELTTTAVEWAGIGEGHGHLTGRRATVRAAGRRVPRPVERDLWLPGLDGRVALAATATGQAVAPVEQVVA